MERAALREMRTAVKALEMEMQVDAAMADDSLRDALHARERQEHFEAIRLLELSCSAIEDATPDRLKRLRAMGVLIRMAVALSPVRPLRMRDYHLRELIAVVGAASALHHVLVTALERFLLRVQVLGVGFRLALRVMVVAATGQPTGRWHRAPGSTTSVRSPTGRPWTGSTWRRSERWRGRSTLSRPRSGQPCGFRQPSEPPATCR